METSLSLAYATTTEPETHADPTTIVIGGGPVGMRVAQLLAQRGVASTVLSDERHDPYNRVRLTPLLSGDVQFGDIALSEVMAQSDGLCVQTGLRAISIDRDAQRVTTSDGQIWPYHTLVIATGSRAFVPSIPGAGSPGVYTFRTADDVSALLARSFSARDVTVVGGGLLGLEAARGLKQRGCHVTVVEHENRLMPRQLDVDAASYLKTSIEALDVDVRISARVAKITGEARVEAVHLADGTVIESDTVVICTGVRANIALAQEAGLGFDRGILVNHQMQTRDPTIYAVGECAQFEDQVIGLVGPGYAQAEIAVDAILGGTAQYAPPPAATKLKVIGADVFSVGEIEQLEVRANVSSLVWTSDSAYRRIFVDRGKLVGAIAIGAWDQISKVQDAVQNGASVYPWMLFRFRRSGEIWGAVEDNVADMPAAATVCNCTGVTCGQIRDASMRLAGAVPDQISAETGAGTVCGTCKPLIAELLDTNAAPEPVRFSRVLLGVSGIAVLLAMIPLLVGYVPLPTGYDAESLRVWAWRDNIVKQWSGFILLGIILAAMIIGLRKRLRIFDRLGGYDGWRVVHIGIGLIAVLGFFAHTGFRLGANWNMALGLAFVATLIMGAVAGMATGGDTTLRAQGIGTTRKPARRVPTWLHILAIWPLPLLLLFHVLTVYAY